MAELHDLLERRASGYEPPSDLFDRVLDRRRRRDRNRRIGAAVVGLAVAVAGIGGLLRTFSSGGITSPAAPSEPTASPTTQNVTENGEGQPYTILDGEVTFRAAPPWEPSFAGWDHGEGSTPIEGPADMTTLLLDDRNDEGVAYEQRVRVLADPLPIETGCRQGPAPADAEALARSIRSDPDIEATAPVAASVGGIEALRMDVVAAPGASVCDLEPAPWVVTETGLKRGHRMRLYLLDLPGRSARILAIAISAPEPRFERVAEAAAPVLDSFDFRTG